MAQDWDIKSRSEACSRCETPFVDEQKYYATLTYGQEGYSRADFCHTCWPEQKKSDNVYSIWQGVFKMPLPPQEALRKETAESLLRKLMEDDDQTKINAMYILAVMLERKRILIERDVQIKDDGTKIRFYEHRQTGETFVVPDPALRLDELESVQEEVVIMLGGTPPKGKGSNRAKETAETEGEDDGLDKYSDAANTDDEPEDEDDDFDDEDDDEYDDDDFDDEDD